MSLTTILKEMDTNRPQAEMDVLMGSPETHGARIGMKRAGVEAMERLRLEYRNELMTSTTFIVVTGGSKDTFTQLASSEAFGCFTADPEDFYNNLASRIDPSLFGREGTRHLFTIASNILEDKAMELNIREINSLAFSEKYNSAVNKIEDFVPLIRRAINDQVGPEIVGINSVNSIVDAAIAKKHAAPVTPVLLTTGDENFALSLHKELKLLNRSTTKVFLVVAGKASNTVKDAILVKKVTEESVGEALAAIRTKILQ